MMLLLRVAGRVVLVASSGGVHALQDEFLRAMKGSLGASLKAASAALEHSAEAGAVALEQPCAPCQWPPSWLPHQGARPCGSA